MTWWSYFGLYDRDWWLIGFAYLGTGIVAALVLLLIVVALPDRWRALGRNGTTHREKATP